MKVIAFVVFSVFLVSACSTVQTDVSPITGIGYSNYAYYPNQHPQYVRDRYVHENPDLPESFRNAIRAGELELGMSRQDALAAHRIPLYEPTIKRKYTTEKGTREVWTWETPHGGTWLRMEFDESGWLAGWSE
jgi:hypothetical protein